MKFFYLLLLYSFPALGQTIYLSHEVDKTVEPAGGFAYLNQFINSNVQVPFTVKGLNGRVYVKGVVELNGSMSQLEVTKGIDSMCNQEAIRVLSLYKSWKPAVRKGGEKVRQTIVYPVSFIAPPKSDFDSVRFAFIKYMDGRYQPTSDPKSYKYRSILPVNKQGYLRDNVVYEQMKGGEWRYRNSVPFLYKEIWHKNKYGNGSLDSIRVYQISARDENMTTHASEATFQMNGRLLSFSEYATGKKASMIKDYDLNGMLRKIAVYDVNTDMEMTWYDNGQIQYVLKNQETQSAFTKQQLFINAWDRDGTQLVKEGEGYWKWENTAQNGDILVEEGPVSLSKKNGKWLAKSADSSLSYQEIYDNGIFKEGFSLQNRDTLVYSETLKPAEFYEGTAGMYRYLAQNIKYPVFASRSKISGQVLLSFVVCEDGSLCDYKVVKGVESSLDDEALRVVKSMSGNWKPGVLRGKKVKVKYNLPINFNLR